MAVTGIPPSSKKPLPKASDRSGGRNLFLQSEMIIPSGDAKMWKWQKHFWFLSRMRAPSYYRSRLRQIIGSACRAL
jgi:hypothetical protein